MQLPSLKGCFAKDSSRWIDLRLYGKQFVFGRHGSVQCGIPGEMLDGERQKFEEELGLCLGRKFSLVDGPVDKEFLICRDLFRAHEARQVGDMPLLDFGVLQTLRKHGKRLDAENITYEVDGESWKYERGWHCSGKGFPMDEPAFDFSAFQQFSAVEPGVLRNGNDFIKVDLAGNTGVFCLNGLEIHGGFDNPGVSGTAWRNISENLGRLPVQFQDFWKKQCAQNPLYDPASHWTPEGRSSLWSKLHLGEPEKIGNVACWKRHPSVVEVFAA